MNADLRQRVRLAWEAGSEALVKELGPSGYWTGELSSSALSTATAVTALTQVDRAAHADGIRGGLHWLAAQANPDGGWGDTVRSRSNLSTTALVWAAFGAAEAEAEFAPTLQRAFEYLGQVAGPPDQWVSAIEALYGRDRTFSVPITMTLALSGRLGPEGWRRVRPLPFELAMLPRGWFGALRLPVVSYALPALIAIGQVIHQRSGRWHPLRSWSRRRTLEVLTGLQPVNGGFLEAIPLTSFVTMSLAGMGQGDHPVARKGAAFLRHSVRQDGSWPIDTNLATWVSTLAIQALGADTGGGVGKLPESLSGEQGDRLRDWLLGQQYRVVHPYTGAAPGGWAWTDLPGGVPDADDTAGALLALRHWDRSNPQIREAAIAGVQWLLGLQNRDGGLPTFCQGWGALPFDRSTPELTAHGLQAWAAWRGELAGALGTRLDHAMRRALGYLRRSQRSDGAWLPLWFGNEEACDQQNPVYGTARVLAALRSVAMAAEWMGDTALQRAAAFLVRSQGPDGSWGGEAGVVGTAEETSLALAALAGHPEGEAACERGLGVLLERWDPGRSVEAAPIGLYFARLWYYERLYPRIFAVAALGRWGRDPGVTAEVKGESKCRPFPV